MSTLKAVDGGDPGGGERRIVFPAGGIDEHRNPVPVAAIPRRVGGNIALDKRDGKADEFIFELVTEWAIGLRI